MEITKIEGGICRCLDGMEEIVQVPILENGTWPQGLMTSDGSKYMIFSDVTSKKERLIYTEVTEKVWNKLMEKVRNGSEES